MARKRVQMAQWLEGHGIEIGALHRPVPVPRDARVTYVDHLTNEDLRAQYPELAHLDLAPVSVIGSADDLSAFADGSLDFVIANHLLEHLEYPLRALLEFQRVLRPGGLLFLALPDKRVTFDRDREVTPVEHVIEEYATKDAARHRRDHFRDWAVHVDRARSEDVEEHVDGLMQRDYSIHFHVWRPDTFLDLIGQARDAVGLRMTLLQLSTLEFDSDDEFCMLFAMSDPETPRLPPLRVREEARPPDDVPWPVALRRRLAKSPIGPPVRRVRRALRGVR